jgi:hypothetical protein
VTDISGAQPMPKTKKPLFILGLLSVLILVVVGVTYRSTTVLVDKTVAGHQQASADEAAKMTEIWLGQQTRILEATVASVSALPLVRNPDSLRLLSLAMQAGHFSDVYIGTTAGELIDGAGWTPPAGYDPRVRPWYRRAMEAGDIAFTTPYIDLVTNQLVIALVSPIMVEGTFRGVMGADTGSRYPGRQPVGGQGRRDRLRLHRQRQGDDPCASQPGLCAQGPAAGYRAEPGAGDGQL